MSKSIKKYIWLFELIGAALVLTLSILVAANTSIISLIVGMVFIFLGLFRLKPLIKTTDDKTLKWLYGIEIILEVIIGLCLVFASFTEKSSWFRQFFTVKGFGYFVGAVLYLRGFTHFFATNIRKEQYPVIFFVVNIILLTLGSAVLTYQIISKGNFSIDKLKWIIFLLGIVTTGFITYNGVNGYKNYRNLYVSKKITTKIVETEAVEVPTSDEIGNNNLNIDNNIVPENEVENEINL